MGEHHVYCINCTWFAGFSSDSETCRHPHAAYEVVTALCPETQYRSIHERNADNDCPDFTRGRHQDIRDKQQQSLLELRYPVGAIVVSLMALWYFGLL